MAAILDLLSGELSPAEKESVGVDLHAYNVEVSEVGKAMIEVPVLAADSVDAITQAFSLLFPDWDNKKPTSGMRIKVVAFERRK